MLRNSRLRASGLMLGALVASIVLSMPRANAQLATFDAANFVKNTENEVHLWYVQYQQAQQVAMQIKQLEQEMRSGALPTVTVWRNAQSELQQLSSLVHSDNSISLDVDNVNSQFARYFPGCGQCNIHYGYDQQVRTATMSGIRSALSAAAQGNQQMAEENLSLDTLKNANHNGSQYAAVEAGNQIAAMLVEQMQKERYNQTMLMQAEGLYYTNEVQREADTDQAKSQARATWWYFLHGQGVDPLAVSSPNP